MKISVLEWGEGRFALVQKGYVGGGDVDLGKKMASPRDKKLNNMFSL